MSDPIYRRQCKCTGASASGPRTVLRLEAGPDGSKTLYQVMVPLACDQCDEPWRLEEER